MKARLAASEELMATRLGSVDPSKFPDEVFDLYSIPAYDSGEPEVALGRSIGSTKQIVQPGDILLSKIVPHIRRVWVVGESRGRRIIASGEWIVFRSNLIIARYLRHVLLGNTFHAQFMNTVSGVGGSLLRARPAFVAKIQIPIPSKDEQKRIADILDKADALRAKRREAISLINSLTQSIFLEMFGDPVSNDRNWNFQKVSDFVDGFETGKSLSADDQNDLASPYRVLKISAVTSLEYKPAESKALPPNYIPPKSHFVKAGDLLFSRANTSELIGATAFVFSTPDNMLLPDKLWRFVWHEVPKADPLFVWHLFRQPKFREEISRRSTGSSGSMKNISQDKVLSIEVGLPDLELQLQFSKKIQGLQKNLDAFKKSDYHLSNLFISLQNHCFSGNLK